MPLTPLDIHNKEFKKVFRGYSDEEVDEFLDEVTRDFESLVKENSSLKDELSEALKKVQHYQNLEATLKDTLIVAQQSAEEVKANSHKEADLILQQANLEADKLIQAAQTRVNKLAEDFEELRKQVHLYRARAKTMVRAQLELLEGEEEREVPFSGGARLA